MGHKSTDLKKLADEICAEIYSHLKTTFNNPKNGLVYSPGRSMSTVQPGLATTVPLVIHNEIHDIVMKHLQKPIVTIVDPPTPVPFNPFQDKFERVI